MSGSGLRGTLNARSHHNPSFQLSSDSAKPSSPHNSMSNESQQLHLPAEPPLSLAGAQAPAAAAAPLPLFQPNAAAMAAQQQSNSSHSAEDDSPRQAPEAPATRPASARVQARATASTYKRSADYSPDDIRKQARTQGAHASCPSQRKHCPWAWHLAPSNTGRALARAPLTQCAAPRCTLAPFACAA